MRKVSGQKDPAMALIRDLRTAPGRQRHQCFLVEGPELVRRAIEFGAVVKVVLFTNALADTDDGSRLADLADNRDVDTAMASEGLIAKCLGVKPTPACLAVVERRTVSLKEIFDESCSLIQVVENGENIDNLGMLLRSAEAAGVDGVVLAGDTVEPFNRRTVRGSRGAVFNLSMCPEVNTSALLSFAKERGVQVVATSASAEADYTSVDYNKPTAIVVGNEHTGITPEMRDGADAVVRIPMLGSINSLNISVAASIMLYEAVRQRATTRQS